MTDYAHVQDDEELDYGNELGLDDDEPAEAEQPAAAQADEAPAKAEANTSIPYERFKEVNDRLKEERETRAQLEERIARLETASQPKEPEPKAPAFDIEAKTRELIKANQEFDEEKALQIALEIEAYRRQYAEQAAMEKLQQSSAADAQMRELQAVSVELTTKFPFLDSNSPDADQSAIDRVLAFRNALIQAGQPYSEALKTAVYREVMESNRFQAAGETKPADTNAQKVLRNAKAAASQPPLTTAAGAGAQTNTVDIDAITGEEWMKLPKAERERMLA